MQKHIVKKEDIFRNQETKGNNICRNNRQQVQCDSIDRKKRLSICSHIQTFDRWYKQLWKMVELFEVFDQLISYLAKRHIK